MISLRCPHCGKTLNIEDQYAGQTGKCNGCGNLREAAILPSRVKVGSTLKTLILEYFGNPERMTGSHEVGGSIPPISTTQTTATIRLSLSAKVKESNVSVRVSETLAGGAIFR